MKTVALISGGKDSILSILIAYRYGHEPVVAVNIVPAPSSAVSADAAAGQQEALVDAHEVDSYMFQTVGHEVVEQIAHCLQLPLRRGEVARGAAKDQTLLYTAHPDEQDEVEGLYRLLKGVRDEFPEVRGVTTGAILSNYQRNRVEAVCGRLGLISLAYLWQRAASEVLDMVTAVHLRAILVKTASAGLNPRRLLGKTLEEARPVLEKTEAMYGSHVAGEGGEFETIVLDCPLFRRSRLSVAEMTPVMVDDNDFAPVGFAVLKVTTVEKTAEETEEDATVWAALMDHREGQLRFPSDRMAHLPLLHTLSVVMEEVSNAMPPAVPTPVITEEVECAAAANAAAACAGGGGVGTIADFWSTTGFVLQSSAAVRTEAEAGAAARELFQRVGRLLKEEGAFVFHYIVRLPSLALAPALLTEYEAVAPRVSPPCFTYYATDTDGFIVMEVHTLPPMGEDVDTADTRGNAPASETVHAQSRSCWAAGRVGPYAQAHRFPMLRTAHAPAQEEQEETAAEAPWSVRVRTTSVLGQVPATWELARFDDLSVPSDDSAAFFASSPAASTLSTDAENAFTAQFAFAYGNAMAYVAMLKSRPEDVTHVTVYVAEKACVSLVPPLWLWCAKREWSSLCAGRVVLVKALEGGAAVQMIVECRGT